MAPHILTLTVDDGIAKNQFPLTFDSELTPNLDANVANGQTDYLIVYTLDVSQVISFVIVSDQDVLLETNSGSSPSNTLSLKANQPYTFYTNAYNTFKLTVDLTGMYITNASGQIARIRIWAKIDATP